MTQKRIWRVLLATIATVCCVVLYADAEECAAGRNCTVAVSAASSEQSKASNASLPFIHEITEASISTTKPSALNMMVEDETSSPKIPKVVALNRNNTNTTIDEAVKGRALNFTFNEHSHENILSSSNLSTHDQFGDLSDVSLDNEEEAAGPKLLMNNRTLGICEKGGLTYENGEKLESGCDSVCTCMNGKMDCAERCTGSFFKKGKRIEDPLCTAKDSDDPCCSVLVCAADTETEPLEICLHGNKTYNRGDKFHKGCEEICTCEAGGKLTCKPKCLPVKKTSDRCVEVPDPKDPCCKTVLCDVTLDDHEPEKEQEETPRNKILSAKFVNSTTIRVKFDIKSDTNQTLPLVEVSSDKMNWKIYKLLPEGYLGAINPDAKYIKVEDTNDIVEVENQFVTSAKVTEKPSTDSKTCSFKGEIYKVNQEFHDNCTSLCICKETGVKCLKIECPTYFGVDVLDPNCVEWETVPPDFTPVAPNCCPDKVRCKNNGSCLYEGQIYQNWQQLPINVTGCQKRCYCEMGNVECQNMCPPVTALPPANLGCPASHAKLSHIQDDDCCMHWVCMSPSPPMGQQKTNETNNDKKGQNIETKPFEPPFLFHPSKVPSKVLGPLVVYANNDNATSNDPLKHLKKPVVSVDENPFYHKDKDSKKATEATETATSEFNPYLGPVNQNFPLSAKGNKGSKVNPKVKTKPSLPGEQNENQISAQIVPQAHPNKPIIEIPSHDKQPPEEILHIINQHPELANYPPGSVLEIHNIPNRPNNHPFINPNSILSQHPARQPQIVPYIVPSDHQGRPLPNNGLPPGVTLEQILQEIQKSEQPHPPYVPYQHYPENNGHIFVAQQSGPVLPTRPLRNSTINGDVNSGIFSGPFPNVPEYQHPQEEVVVDNLEAVDAHTVRLSFSVPRIYVGLHGRVEVRYTHREDNDPNNWELQVFAPPNDLIVSPQLEFEILSLKPDTEYRIKITVTLRDLQNTPSSRVYTVRTPVEVPSTTLPPVIPIEPNLAITDINATWVNVMWRKFTDFELQFIDGVQLRFKEIDGKIYAATPLIHRAVTSYTLENLKPNTKYEIGIYFIPFPNQVTELHAGHMLHFTTANEVDTYGFNVTLEITQIKATSVEIAWSGVPYPEDKYVNIYRAIYQSESGKGDYSTFKIAKRDSPTKTTVMDLKPGTRYRLWLEVYLTNGKIKTSNVQDFITKPRAAPSLGAATQQDKLASSEYPDHRGDYYGPLVIVAILAAIAILSTLILLLILIRRHSQNKAAITPPARVSQSAYDNPTYKVEIQQETMGL